MSAVLDDAPVRSRSRSAFRVEPLVALAIACGLFAAWFAIRFAAQPPLDLYSFRQSQTALTAYWLQQNGFGLAYETPVVGPPWSIPFEFPIYQWIVASLSTATGAALDETGRLVAFLFLIGCLFPIRTITTRLRLSPLVFPIFAALFLSSPTYVYWGRTFMIETTALFFSVVAIRWFVESLLAPQRRVAALAFVVFMTLGLLQKATTGLPVVAVCGLVFLVHGLRSRSVPRSRLLVRAALCFGIPLAATLAWTIHTDQVKALNPFAATALTTSALHDWNWGTLAQRFSPALYRDVVWKEILAKNCAGVLGVVVLIAGIAFASTSRARIVIGVALLFGGVPLFVFTNLHIEHSYYQTADVVFFLFAIAVALGHVPIGGRRRPAVAPTLVALLVVSLVASNVHAFLAEYRHWVEHEDTFESSKEMALATLIEAHVPRGHHFVAFDMGWTSSLAYLSQRKGFMVSDVFTDYEAIRRDPSRFIAAGRLDAVVACPSGAERLADFLRWSSDGRRWKIGLVDDCYLAVPGQAAVDDGRAGGATDCDGAVARITPVGDALALVRVHAWAPRTAGDVWFVVTGDGRQRLEMLDVTSPTGTVGDASYTRLTTADAVRPGHRVRIERLRTGRLEACRARVDIAPGQAADVPMPVDAIVVKIDDSMPPID